MSSFPQDLPPRPEGQSWKERNCPGMRTCWHFSWEAYNLKTSDTAVLLRRICMWIVLALRTFLSILAIIVDAYGGQLVSMIVGIILAVLGFLFIAWCLATIGEAKGRRRVMGFMVGRWHFDIFLLLTAVIHLGVLIGHFVGMRAIGVSTTWLIMWVLIFAVAWIATWTPEPESYV